MTWLDSARRALVGNPYDPTKKPSALSLYTALGELNTDVAGIEADIATLSANQTAGTVAYATRAELYANLVPGAGARGEVYADSTAAYNGVYSKVGATTTGSWTKIADLSVTELSAEQQALADQQRAWVKAQQPLMTFIGDSKTEDGLKVDPADPPKYINSTSYGFGSVLASVFPVFNADNWINTSDPLGIRSSGSSRGKSSQTTAQLLAAYAGSVAPYRHDNVFIAGPGVNDFWLSDAITVSDYVDNMEGLVLAALANASGWVFVAPIHPVMGTHADFLAGSANRIALDASRGALLTMLGPYIETGRVVFIDFWAAPFGDGTSYGTDAAFYYDGLHLNTLGNHILATQVRDTVLRRYFPNVPAIPAVDDRNALVNYKFEGTAGSSGTRTSGVVPTGFNTTFGVGSTMNAVTSVSADTDGRNRLEVYFAPAGSGSAVERFDLSQYSMPVPTWLAGQWCMGFVELEFTAWDAWRGAQLTVDGRLVSDVQSASDGVPYNIAADQFPSTAFTKILRTPPFIMPADRDTLSWYLNIWTDATKAGLGYTYVKKRGLCQVPDPRLYRGYL